MFIDTLKLIVEIHSFILSAQNGALRLLWVFKRNQERGKDINRSEPMDSTSATLFRTFTRKQAIDLISVSFSRSVNPDVNISLGPTLVFYLRREGSLHAYLLKYGKERAYFHKWKSLLAYFHK